MTDFKQMGTSPIGAAVANVVAVTKEELEKKMAADKVKAKQAANAGLDYLDNQIDQAKNEVKKI